MKQSTKGVLLSGLVYPGLGQLFLGRIYSGAALMVLTTIGFLVIIYRIIKRVYLMIDQLLPMLAQNAVDFRKIMELAARTSYAGWNVESISLMVVFCCWAVSIVHAYLSGKHLDRLQH